MDDNGMMIIPDEIELLKKVRDSLKMKYAEIYELEKIMKDKDAKCKVGEMLTTIDESLKHINGAIKLLEAQLERGEIS
jgi:hypothetical protein